MKGEVKAGRISLCHLGFALGLVWGVGLLLLGLISYSNGYGAEFIKVMGSIYIGYAPTVAGSIVGLFWGFIDAFITGVVIAWIYNYCADKCCKGKC